MGINSSKKRAFTLVEVIVITGVIALTLPALFNIVFAIMQQEAKVIRLTQVKQQGDTILNRFESEVKTNATGIFTNQTLTNQICNTVGIYPGPFNPQLTSIYFSHRQAGSEFGFINASNKMSYFLSTPFGGNLTTDLTTDRVIVTNVAFSCELKQLYSQPVVKLSYDVCYSNSPSNTCASDRLEEQANLHYDVAIRVRNQ